MNRLMPKTTGELRRVAPRFSERDNIRHCAHTRRLTEAAG